MKASQVRYLVRLTSDTLGRRDKGMSSADRHTFGLHYSHVLTGVSKAWCQNDYETLGMHTASDDLRH